jgi:hypothetical protein
MTVRIFMGFDQRESVAMHVCTSSILRRASKPVSFTYLAANQFSDDYIETHVDGSDLIKPGYAPSNAFIFSRFLVPWLCDFNGWAIFMDGDMVVKDDIVKLWKRRDPFSAVQVVKHQYKTRHPIKYLGGTNQDYERKMWSSVMLWNCGHYRNRCLYPDFVAGLSGEYLHRFSWLNDAFIGDLPLEWNWLVDEYEHNDEAKLLHYTIGGPYFTDYRDCDHAADWLAEYAEMNHCTQRGES